MKLLIDTKEFLKDNIKKVVSFLVSVALLIAIVPIDIVKASTIVNIPDNNLANVLSSIIGKPANAITNDDMLALTGTINLAQNNIYDLTGLEYATNITGLYLYSNNISNIAPLSSLTNLTVLNIQDNPIDDLSPLGSLISLIDLSLPSNRTFINYSEMASLTKLKQLYAPMNNISDITFMKNMSNLNRFDLPNNGITDLTPLSGLTKLDYIDLTNNNIDDLKPLLNSKNMTNLSVGGNNKLNDEDIKDLEVLTKLQSLQISNSDIKDISPIASMTDLRLFNVQASKVEDISVLSGLTNLENVYVQGNYITDLSPISGLTNLIDTFVHVEGNFINTFSGRNKSILDNLGITTFREPQNRIGLDPNGQQSFSINVGDSVDTPIYILQSYNSSSWALINGISGSDISVQSSDNNIATTGVSDGGVPYVIGINSGTAEITATFKGINSEYTTTKFNVTVNASALKGSITVKYQDENGIDIVPPEVENNLDLGVYTRNAKNFLGYTLNDSNSKDVDLSSGSLNETIIFSYKKIKGSITVKYQDESGADIIAPDVINNLDLGTYTKIAKDIPGYTLNDNSTKSIELTDINSSKTIIFNYVKIAALPIIEGSYTVQHKDQDGNVLGQETTSPLELGSYTIQAKSFDGYTLNDDSKKTVTLTKENPNQNVIFNYKKNEAPKPIIKGSITIKYQDEDGKDIGDTEIKVNLDLGSYTEKAKNFEDYILDGEESQSITLTEENKNQEITFIYKKNASKITVLPQTGDDSENDRTPLLLITTLGTLFFAIRKKEA